jgi:UDP-glucose:(heptosyl)LPS alpha-1,3-glucosyltransferase
MRIALIARRFDPAGGGTERDLIVTAQGLAEAGHELTIYTADTRGASRRWPVIQVGSRWPSPTLHLMRFAWGAPIQARNQGAELVLSFARSVGADVLRSGGGAHSAYLRAARRWRGEWATAAMRLRPYHRAQMVIERAAFRSPELRRVIAVSELVRNQLIDEFGLEPAKVVTLYNGVDAARFHVPTQAERAHARRMLEIEVGAKAVAFVGNGFARKGLGPLLEAWPAIPGRPLLLVAGGDRSALRHERAADRLGIGARVRFLGAMGNIEQVFQAADAFALPSFFEPFGNAAMEAMACGLGVMTTTQSGVAELLPETMRRFVVRDPGNAAEIAGRMDALLRSGREFEQIARATAEAHPWRRYFAGLLDIIGEVNREIRS